MHTMLRTPDHELRGEQPVMPLRELENIIQRMWAVEPDCRYGERHHLLNTLRQLSIDIERLTFRASFHADEPHDDRAVRECIDRTAQLARNWSTNLWSATPWPAAVLGEARPSIGDTS